MAVRSRPLASAGFDGATTLRPGRWVNSPSRLEGVLGRRRAQHTVGGPQHQRDRHLAAEHVAELRGLVDDLVHGPRVNSTKLIDATGRRPAVAAPTATATMIASEIGMSMTRRDANSSTRPGTVRSCRPGDVLSEHDHAVVGRMAEAMASTVAWPKVMRRVSPASPSESSAREPRQLPSETRDRGGQRSEHVVQGALRVREGPASARASASRTVAAAPSHTVARFSESSQPLEASVSSQRWMGSRRRCSSTPRRPGTPRRRPRSGLRDGR